MKTLGRGSRESRKPTLIFSHSIEWSAEENWENFDFSFPQSTAVHPSPPPQSIFSLAVRERNNAEKKFLRRGFGTVTTHLVLFFPRHPSCAINQETSLWAAVKIDECAIEFVTFLPFFVVFLMLLSAHLPKQMWTEQESILRSEAKRKPDHCLISNLSLCFSCLYKCRDEYSWSTALDKFQVRISTHDKKSVAWSGATLRTLGAVLTSSASKATKLKSNYYESSKFIFSVCINLYNWNMNISIFKVDHRNWLLQ